MKDSREISKSVLCFGCTNFPHEILVGGQTVLCYLERDETPETTSSVAPQPCSRVALRLSPSLPHPSPFRLHQHVSAFPSIKTLGAPVTQVGSKVRARKIF